MAIRAGMNTVKDLTYQHFLVKLNVPSKYEKRSLISFTQTQAISYCRTPDLTKFQTQSTGWNNSKIILYERNYKLRKTKEGLPIQQAIEGKTICFATLCNSAINTDKRFKLSNSRQSIIRKLIKISYNFLVSSNYDNS